MSNVYYDPERDALITVATVDAGAMYEFQIFCVWHRPGPRGGKGTYFWADDAGCSCPSPFEDFELKDLTEGTKAEAIKAFKEWTKIARDLEDTDIVRFVDQVQMHNRKESA